MKSKHITQNKKILLQLFLSTLYISTFTFGGGFVIVSFMKKKFVDQLHWIEEQEMMDLIALAQSSPGAIAVNAAILVGWRVSGFFGMLISVLGTILPPLVILSIISVIYRTFITNPYVTLLLKGMQAGVAAIIFDVVYTLGLKVIHENHFYSLFIILIAFISSFILKINIILILIFSIIIGLLLSRNSKEKLS